jgi:hypothetical protein
VDINTLDSRPEAHAESGEVESETMTDSVTRDSWLYMSMQTHVRESASSHESWLELAPITESRELTRRC